MFIPSPPVTRSAFAALVLIADVIHATTVTPEVHIDELAPRLAENYAFNVQIIETGRYFGSIYFHLPRP
jgi:hypothetical protein